ncbi:maleylpyruvate isomerase N-terminal domain-containing protein [Cellulomonas edaphi]|uniref:Maleylpyruvate isomerase family mycothiol-dependent enzyme n=1 Tax=Cellulomonas edaphi TaxID=3053468 RepID=A0ABT7SA81_9CELL|nr:maleylpyruvate isomerase N-terminal domain-containing protein [Cellulomons edaphi]MDM7832532.1 maleylpyruvate isomerase family mycothiol-dependent enzyme [Cellulomons edaphi]
MTPEDLLGGDARLLERASHLTEAEAHAPVALPGWTRAHVLTHLGDLSAAFARQARYAQRGERIDVYDGGRPGRDASIEAGAARPLPEILDGLRAGFTALEEAWSDLSDEDWSLPCAYRDLDLHATRLCWWRELEVHWVDLEVGRTPADWSFATSGHLVDWLRVRIPVPAVLTATDSGRTWGESGTPVEGPQHALAAWLAGRSSGDDLTGALPLLDPWP